MSNEKIFVGNVQVKEVSPTFKFLKIGLNLDNLNLLGQHMNENGWVNLNLKKNKEGKYYLEVDTWRPSQQTQKQAQTQPAPQVQNTSPADLDLDVDTDMPF